MEVGKRRGDKSEALIGEERRCYDALGYRVRWCSTRHKGFDLMTGGLTVWMGLKLDCLQWGVII